MSVQNPTIPTATEAKGIDSILLDLQMLMDTNLSWLTNGMGRAYVLNKVRTNGTTQFLPLVYLGGPSQSYSPVTPDNDKKGSNYFIVQSRSYPDQNRGFYGLKDVDASIIFSANLNTIDPVLLLTDEFTEHLMIEVEEVLLRKTLGKPYQLEITSSTDVFEEVYSEVDVTTATGKALAKMTYFRFDIALSFKEDCAAASLNRCAAILQNLSQDDLLNCILPTYDFSDTVVQAAVTAQQQTDLTAWLCVAPVVPAKSFVLEANDYINTSLISAYEFEYNSPVTFGSWVKFDTISPQTIWNKFSISRGFFAILQADGSIRFNLSSSVPNQLDVRTAVGAIVINTWYFIAITYSGNSLISGVTVTINDSLQTLTPIMDTLGANTIMVPTVTLKMGANNSGTGTLDGFMNDMRVWNTVLTPTQLTNEYGSPAGTPNPAPESLGNLVLWMEGAKFSTYGITDFAVEDSSGIATGFQSVNMESTDTSTDVPT